MDMRIDRYGLAAGGADEERLDHGAAVSRSASPPPVVGRGARPSMGSPEAAHRVTTAGTTASIPASLMREKPSAVSRSALVHHGGEDVFDFMEGLGLAASTRRSKVPVGAAVENVSWLEEIYRYLAISSARSSPGLGAPETITFRFMRPHCWYQPAPDGSGLALVQAESIDPAAVMRSFCSPARLARSDIVAAYYYVGARRATGSYGPGGGGGGGAGLDLGSTRRSSPDSALHASRGSDVSTAGGDASKTVVYVEYFDQDTLRDFIYNRQKVNNGVLQAFDFPPGGRATAVRAQRLGSLTTIENRISKLHLANRRVPLVDRCATFDGSPNGSRLVELARNSSMRRAATRAVQCLEAHLNALLPPQYRVHSFTAYLKPGEDGLLRFAFCPDLRLQRVGSDALVHPDEARPGTAQARDPQFSALCRLPPTYYRCPVCARVFKSTWRCEVSYATAIAHVHRVAQAAVADAEAAEAAGEPPPSPAHAPQPRTRRFLARVAPGLASGGE
eukprot:CAMPEP_0206042646 /NCGR_PEP_ID=MMETSP1466-20131121/6680_1 /ASSEMBLY_ACC=CAM_ASM_001126 /TAXON_ID=44452 /ORGANISM="Pavlova gyrans, Strain CCMP608" /LENGTH=503 /DNA_ID=CAMNT_0053417361 /DNA_START=67 /DNA_END=1575 /DNA_ORIENTATION=+